MMHFNLGMSLFVAGLFVLLTPGVIVALPKNGTLLQKAILHGVLFAILYHFTHKAVWNWLNSEGFARKESREHARAREAQSKAWKAYKKNPNAANKQNWENAKKKALSVKQKVDYNTSIYFDINKQMEFYGFNVLMTLYVIVLFVVLTPVFQCLYQ